MLLWTIILGGPLVLPLSLIIQPGLPGPYAELFTIVGVITLFLAICATEVLGARPSRSEAGAD